MSTTDAAIRFDSPPPAAVYPLPFLCARATQQRDALGRVAFALFLLANAALILRPADLFDAIAHWPIYQLLIVSCALLSLRPLADQLKWASLRCNPVTFFVLALLCVIPLAHLSHGQSWEARQAFVQFAKITVYYLLLLAILDTPQRLGGFLAFLALICLGMTALALLAFHGWIQLPALEMVQQKQFDPATGMTINLPRLVSAGIFHDPNDLCLLLIVAITICLWGLGADAPLGRRIAWVILLAVFGYAVVLTHSRGGFLGLVAGFAVLGVSRWGWRKTIVVFCGSIPILLEIGGRQTDLSLSGGTGQNRLQLWSQGLALLRQSPLLGIGFGNYAEQVGYVGHNSFLHAYTELGFVGGTLFLGAFYYAIASLIALGRCRGCLVDAPMRRLQPLLLMLLGAYAAGAFALSRTYVAPTYLVLGLAAAYFRVARFSGRSPLHPLGMRLMLGLVLTSACFIGSIYVFVRVFVQWSST